MLKLSESEAITLYQYLKYQFIHYENEPLTSLVKKIGNHLQGDMNMADFNVWIDDEDVSIVDVHDILTGKRKGEFKSSDLEIELIEHDGDLERSEDDDTELEIEPTSEDDKE